MRFFNSLNNDNFYQLFTYFYLNLSSIKNHSKPLKIRYMNQTSLPNLKPFVKWAGGKTQLLDIINLISPTSYNRLIEPFAGGGAFFLNKRANQTIINDINKELITSYLLIKKDPNQLMNLLKEYENNHDKDFFEILRKQNISDLTELGIAARFIYLNKTCFNGLYRVNSKGGFNVPWGKKEKAKIFDKENILAISEYLNVTNSQIFNKDYKELISEIKPGDFLFVDPPYDNEDDKGFTSYSIEGFNKENQKELFTFLKKAEKKGARWLLTNHSTEFIKELYKEYPHFIKKVNRSINSQGDKRMGNAKEIFIWNYELTPEQSEELKFEKYFTSIKHTNVSLENLIDLKKVEKNIGTYKENLTKLSNLLGNEDGLNERIEILWRESPKSFQTLPVLLAIKDKNFSWLDNDNEVKFWEIDDLKIDEIKNFIFGSKLIEFFTNGQIKNLQDYALGIEIGLDTHSRKNRSGQMMEKTIENLLISYNLEYQSQKHIYLEGDKKVFDFWVKINDKEYYCETNFFNSQGSKISEVIRSYNHLYKLSEKENINFLWIGDGRGLRTVKEVLRNTFFSTKNFMFTISSFEEWINKNLEVKI